MKLFVSALTLLLSLQAAAADIASCSNPSGKSYYPNLGLVSKERSGWSDDAITGGITKVSRIGENEYDILYVDSVGEINSAKNDGGRVALLTKGKRSLSFIVIYPGKSAEVYTFLRDESGKLEYFHTVSRSGDEALITKASLMRGDCSYINFDALE